MDRTSVSRDLSIGTQSLARISRHFHHSHPFPSIPVRNEVVEIVETQMAETNGDLVQFGEGRTLLTLHFKREVVV